MTAVFHYILQFGIQAGWLVPVLVILHLILRKCPRYIICALWALVAVRLICPFHIESIFSLIPRTQDITLPISHYTSEAVRQVFPAIDSELLITTGGIQSNSTVGSGDAVGAHLFYIASVIWIAGMIIMLLYATISYLRLWRMTRESVKSEDGVYLCDCIPSPFILGVIRPKIYLPSNISEHDKPYVLAHEKAHIKRRDYLWKPLGFLLLSIYWFNPLLWVAYILLCKDIEMACDEKVIKELGLEVKKPYAIALINSAAPRRLISACPLAFGETSVKSRIKNVLNYKKPAFWIIIVAVVLSIAVAVCFLTNPINKEKNVTDHLPDDVYAFEYGDIDGDGKEELVTLSFGSSSGITATELRAYDAGTLEQKYLSNVLNNDPAHEPTLKKDGEKLYVEGYNLFTVVPPNTDGDGIYYRCVIAVDNGAVVLTDSKAILKLEPYEAVDQFFKANADKFPMNPKNQDRWTWSNVKSTYYGGTYLDGAEQVILLTDTSQMDDYAEIGMGIRYEQCEYSYEELNNFIKEFYSHIGAMSNNEEGYSTDIMGVSLDEQHNRVIVDFYQLTDETVEWFKEQFGDKDFYVFRESDLSPEDESLDTLTVSTDLPTITYADEQYVYLDGDCGVVIYDYQNERLVHRIPLSFLRRLGFTVPYSHASADGQSIIICGKEQAGWIVMNVESGEIVGSSSAGSPQDFAYFEIGYVDYDIRYADDGTNISARYYITKDGTQYKLSVPGWKIKNTELTVTTTDGTEKTYYIFE